MTIRHTVAQVPLLALTVTVGCFASRSPATERSSPAPPVGAADAGPADPPAPRPSPPEAVDAGTPMADAGSGRDAPEACVPSQLALEVELSGDCGTPDDHRIHWGSAGGFEASPMDDGLRFTFRLAGAGDCRVDVRGVGPDIAEALSLGEGDLQASFREAIGPEEPFVLFEEVPNCPTCEDCECPPSELVFFAASRPLEAPAPVGTDLRLGYYRPEAVTFAPGEASCEADTDHCTYRQLALRAQTSEGSLTSGSVEAPVGTTRQLTSAIAVRNLRLDRWSCASGPEPASSGPDVWAAWRTSAE